KASWRSCRPHESARCWGAAPWSPSIGLRSKLLIGTLGVLAAAGLAAAATLMFSDPGQMDGFTLAHGHAWATLPALFLVLLAYVALARAAESPGLKFSSLALFGGIVLGQIGQLAALGGIPGGSQVGIWLAEVLGPSAGMIAACAGLLLLLLMGMVTLWFGLSK